MAGRVRRCRVSACRGSQHAYSSHSTWHPEYKLFYDGACHVFPVGPGGGPGGDTQGALSAVYNKQWTSLSIFLLETAPNAA